MATKDGPHARRGKPDAHRHQLAVDPAISPRGVLCRQPEDYLDGARGNARSTWTARIGPSPPNEISMPAKQGLRLDKEPPKARTTNDPAQSREQRPIPGPQRRARHLATEHRHLVAEHDDLDR